MAGFPITMQEHPTNENEEDWVDIGTYPTLDDAYDHALVALAMGETIRVEESGQLGEFDLQTEAIAAEKIVEELKEYESEAEARILPKVLPSNWAKHPAGATYLAVWATILIVVFYYQVQDPRISNRFASSSLGLIEHGEWWRPFTALFLHGDGPHIVGNLASGAVFSILVSKSIGPLKGWAMILLSGTLGNATTSFVTYPESFLSLGASTAVFGALGILSGIGLIENCREEVRMPWVRVLAPLFAGLILLGWLGGAAPGSGTDVFGHVFGFMAGVAAGAICRHLEREPSEALRVDSKRAN
ncbi:MAG: rhomboid family intramembrane serine protease [Akkermansiaceae bacterium]